MRTSWTLPILLAASLAGCLGDGDGDGERSSGDVRQDPLSEAQYAILPPEEVWVASSQDGKRIHNALYRPDTNGSVPVWINFSPYWGDTAMTQGDAFSQYLINEYVPRGYAVVLSAVRGTGHSEGCFQIGGDLELQDAYDVVDFFASEPWSNGNVGAGGKSYDATTQNGLVAKFPHPALKAVFHVSGITDMYRYNYYDGVPYSNGLEFTPRYYATQGLDEYAGATNGAGSAADEDPESLARLVDDVACVEFPEHVASGEGSAAHGIKDAYWQERDWTTSIAASSWNGSIFLVHGLSDWNVKPDHVLPWLDGVQANGNISVLGWLHQWQEGGTGHVYPMRTDWNETMLRWMDATLKGKDTLPAGFYGYDAQGSDGLWRRGEMWPAVPGSAPQNVTRTDGEGHLLLSAGNRVTGAPVIRFTATPLTADPVLHAVWYDEAPDGTVTWMNEAVLRGALSDDLAGPRPAVPGMAAAWELRFFPMDAVLEEGHKWVVFVGDPLPAGAGPDPGDAGLVILPSQQAVQYDLGTVLIEAQVSDAAAGLVASQPTPMACFTC